MNSRDAQDVILRLLSDGPFRRQVFTGAWPEREVLDVAQRVDRPGLERFALFLFRHYYRERIVHLFKYSRALATHTGRSPEAVLKTDAFASLFADAVLGSQETARRVAGLLQDHLTRDCDAILNNVPYWRDLVEYESAFFVTDALPAAHVMSAGSLADGPLPRRAENATILELEWDLPEVLPSLLKSFDAVPLPKHGPTCLLFARDAQGEVTVVRCGEAVKRVLQELDGRRDAAALAAASGLDTASLDQLLGSLVQIGAVVGA
ncbi:MAG: hypothetical protein HY652_00520 [Acidobacteria bacterium]|nr:hypothetical protein [Acidobacteriota bacterium]